jgi:hypothetical protein
MNCSLRNVLQTEVHGPGDSIQRSLCIQRHRGLTLVRVVDAFQFHGEFPFSDPYMQMRAAITEIIPGDSTFVVLTENGISAGFTRM